MRILFGTDGSAHAAVARDLLASLRWPAGSTIRAVSAVAPQHVVYGAPLAAGFATEMEALESEHVAQAETILEEAVRGIPQGSWKVERAVLRGRTGTCLVEDASGFGADVIVLGSRGHGPILSMLLGSVSAEVVDHAPCPVLVARRARMTRVVLAHDGSEHALEAERLLTSWPVFADTAIEVFSVAQHTGPWQLPLSTALYAPSVPDYFEPYRELVAEHAKIAEDAVGRLTRAGLRAAPVVAEGDPAAAILRAVDERQADLVLLATHGRTGLERLLLGSVARNVMLHSPVSVLIVRSRLMA
jgi:nucleotide-binding universal stress UspA family protein